MEIPSDKKQSSIWLLSDIDLFAIEPRLLIFGKPKFSTKLSIICSLLFLGAGVALFLTMGADMIYHKNPVRSSAQLYRINPAESKIGPKDHFFIFSLQHEKNFSHYYDPTVYVFRFVFNR